MRLNLSQWALGHRSFVLYGMIVVVLLGLASFFQLGRNEDPAFIIKTMVVKAAWPGATLNDTLNQVTERLERKLQETPHLDYIRSFTKPGVTTIFVNLDGKTNAAQVADTWYHVRKSIADIRQTLPQGIQGPWFNDEFGDTFGIIYGITSDGFTHREVRDYAEDIRSRLLHVPDISRIDILGAQDEKIFIEFSTEQLAGLGIDRGQLVAALQAQNIVSPAGVIETGIENLALRITGAFGDERDILNVNFVTNGRVVRLRDIATVRRAFADPPKPMFRVNGEPAIGLAIAMREGGDILALGRNVQTAMADIRRDLPLGIDPVLVADQPQVVDAAIGEFTASLWQAIGIIMVVSFIGLGLRAGMIVAMSIPLTLAIVFALMGVSGIDLQRVSLGALIIALALLVDDAMTTIDVVTTRVAQGDTKAEAASYAFQTVAMPMLAGTLVTAAGFVPIGFAQSSAGEYTFSIFAVVAIALIVSWFVAVIFAPLLAVTFLPEGVRGTTARQGPLTRGFRSILLRALRAPRLTIAITLGAFAAALLAAPFVPRQFFPASDRPELLVDLSLPRNASIRASEDVTRRVEQLLAGDPDIRRFSAYVGQGAIRFYLPLNVQLPNDSFSQFVIVANDLAARDRVRAKLEQALIEQFPGVVSRISALELGPPVGWPIQYRVSGPDLDEVRAIAQRLAAVIANDPNTRDVNFDWMEPARQVQVRIDQDEARLLGLSSAAIAASLNSYVTGAPVTQIRDDIYLIDVIASASDEQRVSLEGLRTVQVPLAGGQTVALSQVARFEPTQEYPLVWRRNRLPTLTVQAEVGPGVLPETVASSLAENVAEVSASLPAGYAIALGGTVEESAKSRASVLDVVPVMILLMLTVLMAQLQSFTRLSLVLAVVPMGLIGVVMTLLLTGRPLGFVAILGALALMGLIAKNAVILLEQIKIESEKKGPAWNAVMDATTSRLRPIMLTAVSTILGLIPIAPTVFWGPMAFAIMGGLLVGTAITLLFLPALYVTIFRIREPAVPDSTGETETPAAGAVARQPATAV
jgi:multidrug efflux pump subunit AcrB